ncbi:putative glycosyl [Erysiphe necator]|uniref:Putative glycosyl n=1 Tax=Uncinula necator TaxID=52586 RepID=A0A0B1P199_UNCNE|nr:putative glycosyl [Erysiphe necator]
MLSGQAHLYYYSKIAKLTLDFNGASQMLRYQYETEQPQQKDFSEWSTITLSGTLNQNSDKSLDQYFELMLDNLQNLQLRLAPIYHTQKALRDKIMYACRSIPEFCLACFSPIPILEGVCNQLRSSILIAIELPRKPFINQKSNLLVYFFTDRRYHGVKNNSGSFKYSNQQEKPKKCFVCKQPGCWSSKHSKHEREISYENFRKGIQQRGRKTDDTMINQ